MPRLNSINPIFEIKDTSDLFQQLSMADSNNFKSLDTWCESCTMELKSSMHAKTHYMSVNHLMKASLFHCKVCNVGISNDLMDNHSNSEEHKKNKEVYCDICEVRTVSKTALLEHRLLSSSHIEKAKQLKQDPQESPKVDLAKANLSVPRLCATPQVTVKKTLNGSPTTPVSSSHCEVCNVFYPNTQFALHKMNFPHSAMVHLKNQYPLGNLNNYFSVINDGKDILCLLCDTSLKQIESLNSHLNGVKHLKKFKKRILDEKKNFTTTVASPDVNTTNNIPKQETVDAFQCYVCRQTLRSQDELVTHTNSLPHVIVSKWKSETVALGVPYAEFWTVTGSKVQCTLCQVEVRNTVDAEFHLWTPGHGELFRDWCKDFASWKLGVVPDPKHFHCNVCSTPLPGTTASDQHYTSNSHKERLKLYNDKKAIELLSPKNEAKPILEERELTDGSKEKMQSQNGSIDTQITQEVRKLVRTLYQSKSVPPSEVLEFLKRVNAELAQLRQKYSEEGDKISIKQETEAHIVEKAADHDNQVQNDEKPEADIKDYKVENISIEEDFIQVTVEEQPPDIVENKRTKKKKSNVTKKKNKLFDGPDLKSLHEQIVAIREQTTERGIEQEVLDEMVILVESIRDNPAPPAEILALLLTFSKELYESWIVE